MVWQRGEAGVSPLALLGCNVGQLGQTACTRCPPALAARRARVHHSSARSVCGRQIASWDPLPAPRSSLRLRILKNNYSLSVIMQPTCSAAHVRATRGPPPADSRQQSSACGARQWVAGPHCLNPTRAHAPPPSLPPGLLCSFPLLMLAWKVRSGFHGFGAGLHARAGQGKVRA